MAKLVRDRDGIRPGYRVRIFNGEKGMSEDFARFLGRCVWYAGASVFMAAIIGWLILAMGMAGYTRGGWPFAITWPTIPVVVIAVGLYLWLAGVDRFRFQGPVEDLKRKVIVQASLFEIANSISTILLKFESTGFHGYLALINWREHNHSFDRYQALIDCLGRSTLGRSHLFGGNANVAAGLQIADITRNVKELESLASGMFRVIYGYHIILWHIVLYPALILTAGSILVLIYWFSRHQQGYPLW